MRGITKSVKKLAPHWNNPVGVVIEQCSNSGVIFFLRKKWWLRLFHMVTFQDTSKYLLCPFGYPITFNRADPDDVFYRSLNWSKDNGMESILAFDDKRVMITLNYQLYHMCVCPWIYDKTSVVKVSRGSDYRIGRSKETMLLRQALALLEGD